ncbi:hypothetical protein DCC62_08880 [candidate division KSB1 bacterium]|nr:MAG: hypothetical protein DCC62_08880 [candidate division KSB1 bacterium]
MQKKRVCVKENVVSGGNCRELAMRLVVWQGKAIYFRFLKNIPMYSALVIIVSSLLVVVIVETCEVMKDSAEYFTRSQRNDKLEFRRN